MTYLYTRESWFAVAVSVPVLLVYIYTLHLGLLEQEALNFVGQGAVLYHEYSAVLRHLEGCSSAFSPDSYISTEGVD